MSENDFRKQLLLNEFKTLSKGKNKEEIVPLIFALSQKAKQAGIQFTRQDCELIYKQIVPGGNPPEGWSGIPWNVDFLLLSYKNVIRTTISRGWRHRGSALVTKKANWLFLRLSLYVYLTDANAHTRHRVAFSLDYTSVYNRCWVMNGKSKKQHNFLLSMTKTLPLCRHHRLIVWYALYSMFNITYPLNY